MGLFNFFKSGGVLADMAESLAQVYLNLNDDDGELKKLVSIIVARFLISVYPDKADKINLGLYRLGKMNDQEGIGLLSVCYVVASIEMDVGDIEDYVIKTILKKLRKMGFSERQIFGIQYEKSLFQEAIEGFGFEG